MPETSIIIRTFNEEKHIGNLLRAIQEQDYRDQEVIIVDSGSTDRTLEIAQEFPVTILNIESRDFTFGYALNVGCREAKGKYLVFASAHILPLDNQWLSNLVAPFSNEKVAMVYGRQVGTPESKFSEQMDFKRIFGTSSLDSGGFIDYANNANSAIRKDLWREKQFDEYLFGLEDIDWARHLTKKGHLVHYEPRAAIYHIHNEKWHQVFNRYRREAIAAVRIGLEHPPQARVDYVWPVVNLVKDILNSFPDWFPGRIEEIVRFRYYQWKGSRQGWFRDRDADLNREKYELFFPTANKAVVIRDRSRAEIEKIPLPEMKPGDILVRVSHVGVCRTDLEVCDGSLGYYKNGLANYPIVPGHEFSGTIVKIGASNKFRERFKVGQAVVGECILSRKHTNRKEVGVINHNGAYGHFVTMPGECLHKIPEGIDLKAASLAEPLAVVLRAVRRLRNRLTPHSVIAVIGAGPIGNLSAQVLGLDGYKVSIFDRNKERLALLADKVGSTSATLGDLGKFDVIIEATGSKQALEKVLKESRIDSTILLLGFPYGDMAYNFEDLVGHEKVIIGSVGAEPEDFPSALKLLSKIDTSPFTKVVLPLEDFKKAWELQRSSKHFKILLKP